MKFLSFLGVLGLMAGLAITPASADRDDSHGHHNGWGHARCPHGTHWVPGHRGPHGHWVPAACRR